LYVRKQTKQFHFTRILHRPIRQSFLCYHRTFPVTPLTRVIGAVIGDGLSQQWFFLEKFQHNMPPIILHSLPLSFTVTPGNGFQLKAGSHPQLTCEEATSGPALARLASSKDGGATWIDQGT
jgi:hypothetical protein